MKTSDHTSSLDILRTDNLCGKVYNNNLLILLRKKSLAILDKLIARDMISKTIVITDRVGFAFNMSNANIKAQADIELGSAIRSYKKLVLMYHQSLVWLEVSDITFKDNNVLSDEYKTILSTFENMYKKIKKLRKVEKYLEDILKSYSVRVVDKNGDICIYPTHRNYPKEISIRNATIRLFDLDSVYGTYYKHNALSKHILSIEG